MTIEESIQQHGVNWTRKHFGLSDHCVIVDHRPNAQYISYRCGSAWGSEPLTNQPFDAAIQKINSLLKPFSVTFEIIQGSDPGPFAE